MPLWSSLCVQGHSYAGAELHLPGHANPKPTAYKDILYKDVLTFLCQQFMEEQYMGLMGTNMSAMKKICKGTAYAYMAQYINYKLLLKDTNASLPEFFILG